MPYRNEIDGLRAIAVLSVILFHLGLGGLGGGFVGVDIFFVISGYVIFRGIAPGIESGTFSTRGFVKRRIFRIQPALFVTLLLSSVAAYGILAPAELENFGVSLAAAALSLSNIHFHDVSGNYFAAQAGTQVLLHTWSLGVEEQFYVLTTILFASAARRRSLKRLNLALLIVTPVSLGLNLYDVHVRGDFENAFYFPTHRLWELGLGALLALNEAKLKTRSAAAAVLRVLGAAGVLASVMWIEKGAGFPGAVAVVPVLATFLVILTAEGGTWLYRILSTGPLVAIGKMSYSLYLVHWPVIVLFSLQKGGALTIFDQVLIVAITFGGSALMWKYVEQPFRAMGKRTGSVAVNGAMAFAAVSIVLAGFALDAGKGFPGRLGKDALAIHQLGMTGSEDCPETPEWHMPKAMICGAFRPGDPVEFVIWGDSHAGALASGLIPLLQEDGSTYAFVTMPDCHPLIGVYTSKLKNRRECQALAENLMQKVSSGKIGTIVLVSRWANLGSPVPSPGGGGQPKILFDLQTGTQVAFEAALRGTVARLQGAGARVVLVGPVPEVKFDVPTTLIRSKMNGFDLPKVTLSDFLERQGEVLPALEAAKADGADLFLPHIVLCADELCRVEDGGVPLYSDDDHLNFHGSALVSGHLRTVLRNAGVGN